MAEEVELLEADVDEDADEDVDEVPPVLLPNRLVADVNAEEALGAELERAGELDVDELEAVEEAVLLVPVELVDESRPYPLRLPLKLGVMSDT